MGTLTDWRSNCHSGDMSRKILLFLLFIPTVVLAQESEHVAGRKLKKMLKGDNDSVPQEVADAYVLINGQLHEALVIGNDTIPLIALPPVNAVAKREFPSKRDERRYYKLVAHIKKVLPYAKLAGTRMREVEEELKTMSSKERKKRLKLLEKEIKRDYEGDLRKLTFTQGRILIKLLDRESGMVSYDIVKHFRGGFTAWFFQGVAKMFGYDLKSEYDPEKDDRLIESIVVKIENGEL